MERHDHHTESGRELSQAQSHLSDVCTRGPRLQIRVIVRTYNIFRPLVLARQNEDKKALTPSRKMSQPGPRTNFRPRSYPMLTHHGTRNILTMNLDPNC